MDLNYFSVTHFLDTFSDFGEACFHEYIFINFGFQTRITAAEHLMGGFLTNELRVTIYCTSYELLFTCELRVTIYCTS